MTTEHNHSPAYTWLTRYSASRTALLIAGLWGFAEATLFFIVPDVYLGFVALFNWRQGLKATLVAITGALLGGALMYGLAVNHATFMHDLLVQVPLIKVTMLNNVSERMHAEGLVALISGPLLGIPYKIYAVQAGQQQLPFLLFLLMTILARLERILPFVLLSAGAGTLCKRWIQRYPAWLIGTYTLLWLGIYLFYFLAVR
jgi:membrane protein YqaA with SNARE-associated domain